jgi:periplasmic protein TonB
MSTTILEAKGPNKALFRTATVAGSAIIWGTLGYLALTYVPKFEKPIVDDGPTITVVPKPIPRDLPPPPPPIEKDDPVKPKQVDLRTNPTPVPQTPTTRTAKTDRPNPLAGELPAGPPPVAPSASGTLEPGPVVAGLPEPVALETPPTLAPPIAEPAPIPAPPPVAKLVVNPVKVSGANPTFPNRPLEAGISGEVTLSFTVTPNGRVEDITILSEEPRRYGFARAAQEAISNWTFQPQTIDGIPVAYPARYTISFKLED